MSITRMGCDGSDVYLTFTDDPTEKVEWPTRCVCCHWCSIYSGITYYATQKDMKEHLALHVLRGDHVPASAFDDMDLPPLAGPGSKGWQS